MRDDKQGMKFDVERVADNQRERDHEPDMESETKGVGESVSVGVRVHDQKNRGGDESEKRDDNDVPGFRLARLASPHFGVCVIFVVKKYAEEKPVGERHYDARADQSDQEM